MNLKSIITASALAVAHFALPTLACDPRSTNDTEGSLPATTWGPDTPADPATLGYFINHFSLNVHNLTASIDFYTSVFGLRHIFTMQATEVMYIAYLGHAQGGRNGTGYQTTEEIFREKNNAAGLIELIYLDVPEKDMPASSEKANTFGHIGVVVPDVEVAQARLEELGTVEILKKIGDHVPGTGKLAEANGLSKLVWDQLNEKERTDIEQFVTTMNTRFVFVADPDGNVVEIQRQEEVV